jgi:hypothetical protein
VFFGGTNQESRLSKGSCSFTTVDNPGIFLHLSVLILFSNIFHPPKACDLWLRFLSLCIIPVPAVPGRPKARDSLATGIESTSDRIGFDRLRLDRQTDSPTTNRACMTTNNAAANFGLETTPHPSIRTDM